METDKLKKIAVVVVHGVGDQQPSESANKVGDLLQSLNVGQTGPGQREIPKYTPFTEQKFHIDVRPVIVASRDEREWDKHKKETQGPFNAWVQTKLDNPPAKPTDRPAGSADRTLDDEIWYQFTRGQLRAYKGEDPENTYDTVRLEGQRNPQDGKPGRDVHLYELYWADLSRLKAGAFSVFTELYQLLFHLASLGNHAINAAALHHKTASWRILRWFQNNSSFVLGVPLLVINLLMLAVAGVGISLAEIRKAHTVAQAAVTAAVAGGIVLSLIGLLLWRGMNLKYTTADEWAKRIQRRRPPYPWIVPGFGWIAVIAATVFFVSGATKDEQPVMGVYGPPWLHWTESLLLAGLFGSIVFLLLRAYDKRRPGALKWAGGLAAVLFIAGFLSLIHWQLPWRNDPVLFWVREFEALYGGLFLFWGLFFGFGFGTLVCGYLAVLNISDATAKDLAKRSRWTGSLLLALPTFVFVSVTLGAWGLIYYLVGKWIPTVDYRPFLPLQGLPIVTNVRTLADHIIGGPAARVLPVIFFMAAVAIVPAIWGLAPVVWCEVFPPSSKDPGHSRSTRLGRWLTLAFRALLVAGILMVTAMLVVFPAGSLAYLLFYKHLQGAQWSAWFGWLSGSAFAVFLLVRGRLKNLVMGFRPLLDVLLDVDNWLREHPLDSNPKARILGRYVSLLRYICAQGYDGVVIIAHSQGTVISADLLRFLKFEAQASNLDFKTYDPDLALLDERNLYLFTMGCPLRQLYALRFPHLYHWARHDDEDLMPKWGIGDIPLSRHPDPKDLAGLNLWENAYRSGDYVGRHLWRTEPCAYIWTGDQAGSPVSGPKEYNSTDGVIRVEFCIGAGAHTHYWDKTAKVIGEELDRLIEAV